METAGPAATIRPRGRAREARENDGSVLDAARQVFAEQGYGAPMAAIAQRAGVGVASIYRRYPSKDSLVHDLRLLALQQVTEMAAEAASAEPGAALRTFLQEHTARASSPIISTFGRATGVSADVEAAADRLRVALESLLARDADTGVIPNGYTAGELMVAVIFLRTPLPTTRERQVEIQLRQVDIYLAGLRASASDPAVVRGAPMGWSEWLKLNGVTPR